MLSRTYAGSARRTWRAAKPVADGKSRVVIALNVNWFGHRLGPNGRTNYFFRKFRNLGRSVVNVAGQMLKLVHGRNAPHNFDALPWSNSNGELKK
jgi:hypothetical protein